MKSIDIEDLVQSRLHSNQGSVSTKAYLASHPKIILLFSVSWCGHSKRFTPELAKYVKQHPSVGVIMIPSEDKESEFESYFENMPWPAVDFTHSKTISPKLMSYFGLRGFPSAVLVDSESGAILDDNVREKVASNESMI